MCDTIRIRKIRRGARYAGDYAVEWLREDNRKRPIRLITTGDLEEMAVPYVVGFLLHHPDTKWDGKIGRGCGEAGRA